MTTATALVARDTCVLARRNTFDDEMAELLADAAAETFIPTDEHNTTVDGTVVCTSQSHEALDHIWRLAHIQTVDGWRSRGIGEAHLKRLFEKIKKKDPEAIGLFFEIESRRETGLTPERLAVRKRRAAFYERLGAQVWDGIILVPTGGHPGAHLHQMEVMWIAFNGKPAHEHIMTFIHYVLTQVGDIYPTEPLYHQVMSQNFGDKIPTVMP